MLKLFLRRTSTKDQKPTVTKPAAAGELAQGELWLNNNHESPGLFARADDDSLIEFNPAKGVHVGGTAPANPKQGQQWFHSGKEELFVYYDNGTGTAQWVLANQPLAEFRNLLINGDLKINQRGVTIAAAAIGAYGPDRWKKVDAGHMTQIVEDVNFVPGAQYTLSWKGGTPQQLTAPATGHWTLPNIPITATEIQLERGLVATLFERRIYGLELILAQRYYQVVFFLEQFDGVLGSDGGPVTVGKGMPIPVPMRAAPTIFCSPQIAGAGNFRAASSPAGAGFGITFYWEYHSTNAVVSRAIHGSALCSSEL
jgi:hypothetical protein